MRLERTKVTKFLGVLVDENLSWENHIELINTKISKSIGILYKSRNILQKSLLKQLYFSFVHSYLNYANKVWASTNKCKLSSIYRTQKHAIRIIYFKDKFTHTKPLCNDIKAMNVYEINVFQIFSFTFKCKEIPSIFARIYSIKSNNYNIRSFGKLIEPFCRKKLCEYSISIRGPKLWNKLFQNLSIQITSPSPFFEKNVKSIISLLKNILDYF